ncbi:mitochondrial aspartate-glutamate transporter agc1 [Entomophthora muscae]|uniref:Mitochondrial aspartate-glutamate transporter agc1 n=1 Tax=Entomophthora muscae TaxID=34485 RepID=A0ACC2SL94_9FUNG|nr:mitochondrial aspartate-glutamate transporter agc1 [Entomophthora muscae]
MTKDDFINAILPKDPHSTIHRDQYGILFGLADLQKKGYLSFTDFVVFEDLLARPDAEFVIAFKLFDVEGNGKVSVETFKRVLRSNWDPEAVPFDFQSSWFHLYTGGKKLNQEIGFDAFCQILKGLQAERVRQAFRYFDPENTGHISPENFKTIVRQLGKYKLSEDVIAQSPTLCNVMPDNSISYACVIAFHNVVRQLDLVQAVANASFQMSHSNSITKEDFMKAAFHVGRYSLITPMEVDIIFHFASEGTTSGQLTKGDFSRLLDPTWRPKPAVQSKPEPPSKAEPFGWEALKSAYSFLLGSVAGAVGATVVYPIDLVKTRMQNQRSAVVGQILYKNSLDCFKKVVRGEGLIGLYRGLGPQLIGVAPEKAIKLTVNDLVRSVMTDKATGDIPVWAEMLAGSCAGGSQVVFTNPLEIVKIRLQIQGELAKSKNGPPKRSALWIVRHLGLLGLYKGVGACLLRDVPFSAIYFTAYSHLKRDYFLESPTKKLSLLELLAAGAAAGMPAAYLTTPADVIKTRLQVEAKKGETSYKGIRDAASKILKEEGFRAFFKGGPARIFRSSPQFGVTLAVYELLQRSFPLSVAESKVQTIASKVASPLETPDFQALKSQQALKLLLNFDYKFGLVPNTKPAT